MLLAAIVVVIALQALKNSFTHVKHPWGKSGIFLHCVNCKLQIQKKNTWFFDGQKHIENALKWHAKHHINSKQINQL